MTTHFTSTQPVEQNFAIFNRDSLFGETTRSVTAQFERTSIANSDRPDDFAALKEEALRQMKERKRRRAAVLPAEDGSQGITVHDVKHMDAEVKQRILSTVLSPCEDDGISQDEMVLYKRLIDRLTAVNLAPPTITVRYKDVNVTGKVIVGKRALPTLTASVSSRIQPMLSQFGSSKNFMAPQTFTILDRASGVLKPGRFTLLLGPPSSGKTTFLRSLAGLTRKTPGMKFSYTELSYNGCDINDFVPERSSAYISQQEVHFGELTVRETLDFSARVQGPGHRLSLVEELEMREKKAGIVPDPALDAFLKSLTHGTKNSLATELVLRILSMDHVASTHVGSSMMRGISGGQKKRLTTGEMIVGASRAIFADEISTGLDSNTTHEIIKSLRNLCHILRATVLVGLLQPSPETFDLFDDVILLANGRVCYHGPLDDVLPFFESMGFTVPLDQGVADFLQEITVVSEQEKYWSDTKPYRYMTPRAIQQHFHKTEMWHSMEAELNNPYNAKENSGSDALVLSKKKHGAPPRRLLRALTSRTWILQKRTKMFAIIRFSQVVIMALVLAALFWRQSRNTIDDGNYFMAVIFFSLLYQLLGGTSEMHLLCDRLPVFYKQKAMNFYPAWSFAVPTFLMRIPYSFLESTIWTILIYWLVGFDPSVRFLMHWFITFLINVWSVLVFQLVGAICRDDTIATAIGSFLVLIFVNISGFVINASSVPPWWLEGLWPNPFYWATQALAINEFTSANWDTPNPANPSSTLGIDVLYFRGFNTEYWWTWAAVGYIIATGILNFILFVLALTYLGPLKHRVVLTPEALEEHEASAHPMKFETEISNPDRANSDASDAEPEFPPMPTSPRPPLHPLKRFSVPVAERMSMSIQTAEKYKDRTAIPFTPVVLTFRNVEYSVPIPAGASVDTDDAVDSGPHAGQLRLLRNINGVFRPYVLTALMGASGAGKTTLMDTLFCRKTGGKITGDIRVNGHPQERSTFARVSAYVEQTDVHLPQTSVEEAVAFSARLRLPSSVDDKTRSKFVQEILGLVELDRISGAFVGVPGVSGLSLEQRKRLTIAVELASNCSLLALDEPTSGLDSRSAAVVLSSIRNAVSSGRTVVCTIHQPSYEIFNAFDSLLLLKPGGRVIYNGDLGDNCSTLIEYLQGINGVQPLPPRHNPADWMLEVTSPAFEESSGLDFVREFKESALADKLDRLLEQYEKPAPGSKPLEPAEYHVAPFMTQFSILFKRFWLMYWRNPEYNLTRLAVTLVVAFTFGSLFWRTGSDTSTVTGILNIAGVMFTSCMFLGIVDCLTVQHVVALQRHVMYRERAAGIYSIGPFALAQQAVELPYLLVQTVIYCCIVYWMAYFDADAGKFFLFMLFFYLTMIYFTVFGIAAVALTPAVPLASVLVSFFFGFWNLFSGFLKPQPAMPVYLKYWMPYINPVQWSIEGLAISQLGTFNTLPLVDFTGQTTTVTNFLADRFDWHWYMLGPTVAILLGFIGAFSSLSYFALARINYQRR